MNTLLENESREIDEISKSIPNVKIKRTYFKKSQCPISQKNAPVERHTKSMDHVEKRMSGLNNQVGIDNSVKVQNKLIKIHEWNMGKF